MSTTSYPLCPRQEQLLLEGRLHGPEDLPLLFLRGLEPAPHMPVGDDLDNLDRSDRRKLDVLFELMGKVGQIHNSEKSKKLGGPDGIFEFKTRQIRIPCIFGRKQTIVLLFGLRKKSDRYKGKEIQRAEQDRQWYLSQGG